MKIKVLQFTIAATKGGRTLYVLNNWKRIDKKLFQFDFITFSSKLDFEEELVEQGCKVHHISTYPETNKEQFIKEFDAILDEGYDVIHIHTSFWKDTVVEERAKAKGIKKIIIHSHNTGCGVAISEEEAKSATVLHEKIRNGLTSDLATDYWACSEKAAEWLYGDKIPKKKIKILNNSIDTKKFAFNESMRKRIREEMGLNDAFVLGHVGRLDYAKNHFFVLEILHKLVKTNPNTFLILVGDGKLRKQIENKIRELKLEKHVLLTGRCEEPEKYMQAMDIFVFPSLYEGFPFALVEAQTSGLICFCSDVISKKCVLTDNIEMLSIENIDNWVNKISLFRNGYERRDQSSVMISKGFDINEQIKQIENEYLRVQE